MAKSCAESDKCRKLGNEYFSKQKFDSALEAYNKSVLYASESSESCAFAYGNRSAVLYEMEKFSECLRDIQRALACASCSQSLKEKLLRRKAKCEEEMDCKGISRLFLANNGNDCAIPELCNGSNPKIPAVSRSIIMDYKPETGRRLVAAQDIEAGSVIIVENPYASVIKVTETREFSVQQAMETPHAVSQMKENRYSLVMCHNCHKQLPLDFIPCGQCVDVRFCSETCLQDQCATHTFECGIVNRLYKNHVAFLAYNIFIISIQGIADRFSCRHHSADKNKPTEGTYGVNTDEIYDGSFRCVWNLMRHHENRSKMELNHFEMVAKQLVGLAVSRPQLPQVIELFYRSNMVCSRCSSVSDTEKLNRAIDHMKSTFFRLIEIVTSNAQGVSRIVVNSDIEIGVDRKPVETIAQLEVAAAIYPTAGLMNHSCQANVCLSDIGKTLVVRVIRKITTGEEILHCYGQQFGSPLVSRAERRIALKKQYFFDCKCRACTESEYLQRERSFKAAACPKCSSSSMKSPLACFFVEEFQVPNAMIEDSKGRRYVCVNCGFRLPIEEIEDKLNQIQMKMKALTQQKVATAEEYAEAAKTAFEILENLSELFYVHNRDLMAYRGLVALWLMKQKVHIDVAMVLRLLELNLFTAGFTFGDESGVMAYDIVNFVGVAARALESPKYAENFTPESRSRLRALVEKAKKIFEIHYGQNWVVMKKLKLFGDKMPF